MRAIIIFLISICLASAAEWKVTHVADGDTITVKQGKKQLKIRFYGIDAPESDQRYGKFCTKVLAKKLKGAKVRLKIKATDRYKRTVALVYKDDEDINRYMVEQGCAWAYTYYTKVYLSAEKAARRDRVGLWQDANPIEPYIWRRTHKKSWQKQPK